MKNAENKKVDNPNIHETNGNSIEDEFNESINYLQTISKQKKQWLSDHGIGWTANFVPGKRWKYEFATPDSIIIDDTYSVIEDWNKVGGIAIWHKDALSTINELKMYV